MSCGRGDSANAGASDVRVHSSGPLAKLSSLRAHFLPLMTGVERKMGGGAGGRGEPLGIAPWIVECLGSTPRCRQLGL